MGQQLDLKFYRKAATGRMDRLRSQATEFANDYIGNID